MIMTYDEIRNLKKQSVIMQRRLNTPKTTMENMVKLFYLLKQYKQQQSSKVKPNVNLQLLQQAWRDIEKTKLIIVDNSR